MKFARIALPVLAALSVMAGIAYFMLAGHYTFGYFNHAVDVTYASPIIGGDRIDFTFRRPGYYAVAFAPVLGTEHVDQLPAPFVVSVGNGRVGRTVWVKELPKPLVITIVSSVDGMFLHQFP